MDREEMAASLEDLAHLMDQADLDSEMDLRKFRAEVVLPAMAACKDELEFFFRDFLQHTSQS